MKLRMLAIPVLALALMAPADGSTVAQVEPHLSVSVASARNALTCNGNLKHSPIEPVLFIHGTGASASVDWGWNWNRAFQQRHWAYCDIELPDYANGDIQIAGQYVVRAIRLMHQWSGRKIGIVGHSQGGMVARWAFKYWPDTRAMVADYVGLASSNHGTQEFSIQCSLSPGCNAATWQQRQGSAFMEALNSGPQTWPGISYTEIATMTDEIILPYTSVFLPAASNVTNLTIQQICPTAISEHDLMSGAMAPWLAGVDALTHGGPARLARINRALCTSPLMPGVDPARIPSVLFELASVSVKAQAAAPMLKTEPPLAPYAR